MRRPLPIRALGWLASRLPEAILAAAARWTVRAAFLLARGALYPGFRRILLFQGRKADPASLARLARETADFYATTLVNLLLLCREDRFPSLPRPVALDLLPELERLREQGKGVILAIPHFGDLGLAMMALGNAGLPVTAIFVNANNYRWVEFGGLRFVSLGMAAAPAMAALSRNESVLTYHDLDFFANDHVAPLLGAPVFPPNGVPRLAAASGAPVLPIYCLYESGRYALVCDAPIVSGSEREIEERLLRSLERFVCRYPSQWLIFHDIWDLEKMSRRHHRADLLSREERRAA